MTPQERLEQMHKIITALEAKGITRYRISQDTGITEASLSCWVLLKKKPNVLYLNSMKDYASKHGVNIA